MIPRHAPRICRCCSAPTRWSSWDSARSWSSGLLQVGADVGTFVASRIFWLKMALVVLLLVNGVLILGGERQVERAAPRAWARLHATAVVSLVLWFVITLAGVALTNIG